MSVPFALDPPYPNSWRRLRELRAEEILDVLSVPLKLLQFGGVVREILVARVLRPHGQAAHDQIRATLTSTVISSLPAPL
jgi:hypothetical protein